MRIVSVRKRISFIHSQYVKGKFALEMLLTYEKRTDSISVEYRNAVHVPPHLHEAVEIVYVTDGSVELGVGKELYHMEVGDFAIVFPNVIHHYQVFSTDKSEAVYINVSPFIVGKFEEI